MTIGSLFNAWIGTDRDSPESANPAAEQGFRSQPRPRQARDRLSLNRLTPEAERELLDLENLAYRDHGAAISKLTAISDPDLKASALEAIARGWAKSDPQAASEWVAGLEPDNDSVSAALGLIPEWAAKNPEDCLAWTTSLTTGNLRDVSLAQLADAWVAINPQAALTRYFAMPPEL
jgi:hypothetical protein